jgi:hypothetical protein
MDQRRLADVRAGTHETQQIGGTGYLVSNHLVLTARHVVYDGEGFRPRIELRIGHPADGSQRSYRASGIWRHLDPSVDAALVRIEHDDVPVVRPTRWGLLIGQDPAPYSGLGYPEFVDYDSGRGVEQVNGTIPPLSVGSHGGLILDQAAAPEGVAGRKWPGVSGAAVFCDALLVGVVVADDRDFGNRRLHAVPSQRLLTDPDFIRLLSQDSGVTPALEPVELQGYLQAALSPPVRTPGSLLAPTAETVPFMGRSAELQSLADWRENQEHFSVLLITGAGGQGKTRLARRFAEQCRDAGWAVGFLRAEIPGADALRDDIHLNQVLHRASSPILLVTDYAETRPGGLVAITKELQDNPPDNKVRLLLLSRTVGTWWANLSEILPQRMRHTITLAPLASSVEERRLAYRKALKAFAAGLAALPESSVDPQSGISWEALAESITDNVPDLKGDHFGNVLTLHMAALSALLAAPGTDASGFTARSADETLSFHETSYLRRSAAKRGLFEFSILSDRVDRDDRLAHAWRFLERSLAGLAFLGPCPTDLANAVASLASPARVEDVSSWLTAMYPSAPEDYGCGSFEDRIIRAAWA